MIIKKECKYCLNGWLTDVEPEFYGSDDPCRHDGACEYDEPCGYCRGQGFIEEEVSDSGKF